MTIFIDSISAQTQIRPTESQIVKPQDEMHIDMYSGREPADNAVWKGIEELYQTAAAYSTITEKQE